MSFFKKFFSVTDKEPQAISSAPMDYNGFIITATPFSAGNQYQSCGVISKSIKGRVLQYRFIRADKFSSVDVAMDMIMIKARQIIDEQGENIFN